MKFGSWNLGAGGLQYNCVVLSSGPEIGEMTSASSGSSELLSCTFKVKATCATDETLCLSGGCSSLGNWSVDGLKCLKRAKDDGSVWQLTCDLPATCKVEYRYVLAVTLPSCAPSKSEEQRRVIKEVESVQRSCVITSDNETLTDTYGTAADGSSTRPDLGFLTKQQEVRIMLLRQKLEPLTSPLVMYGQSAAPAVYTPHSDVCKVRVEPFWMSSSTSDFDQRAASPPVQAKTQVSSTGRCKGPSPHGRDDWVDYNIDDVVVFSTQTLDSGCLGFRLHVRHGKSSVSSIGTLLPEQYMQSSITTVTVPLLSQQQQCAGCLVVECQVVKPLNKPTDLSRVYSSWDTSKCLRIGHRGMGSSEKLGKDCSAYMENTVAAFTAAGEVADMVEFDVQLSSDLVPVIFHDFTFFTRTSDKQRHEVRVQDCSLATLQTINMDTSYQPPSGTKFVRGPPSDLSHLGVCDSVLAQARSVSTRSDGVFPTLEEVFQRVPEEIAFDVEIKYPMLDYDPVDVCTSYFDINIFIDKILEVVFRCARKRFIVLTSFCPRTTICLRRKQSTFPVVYLSNIDAPPYEIPNDIRCASLSETLAFAHAEALPGVACMAGPLVETPSLIDDVIMNQGMLLFTWGGATNNNVDHVAVQVKHGINGIVIDTLHRMPGPEAFALNVRRAAPLDSCKGAKDDDATSSQSCCACS